MLFMLKNTQQQSDEKKKKIKSDDRFVKSALWFNCFEKSEGCIIQVALVIVNLQRRLKAYCKVQARSMLSLRFLRFPNFNHLTCLKLTSSL